MMYGSPEVIKEFKDFFEESNKTFFRHLFGLEPIPEPIPKKEYWILTTGKMVAILDNQVYAMKNPVEAEDVPYTTVDQITLLRLARSLDF